MLLKVKSTTAGWSCHRGLKKGNKAAAWPAVQHPLKTADSVQRPLQTRYVSSSECDTALCAEGLVWTQEQMTQL